jgi:ribose-phosphate pyrophosphokinase
MNLVIAAGSGNPALAASVGDALAVPVCRSVLKRFPDSELHVEIDESVRDSDVYLIQPTGPPVDTHLMELLFLADACRRAGAARLTGVVPYFGYARQDRRANGREAVGGRVAADLLGAGAIARIVSVDLHTVSLEGFFAVPLEHLSAVHLLADRIRDAVGANAVIVSPDLGAVKLAERYGERLHRPIAVAHKIRSGAEGRDVKVHGIVGDVAGRTPVIIDDMISTGSTIAAASEALLAAGCIPEITVVATHALLVGPAVERLSALPIKRLVVTDSVPLDGHGSLPLEVVSIAPMLAEAISRLNVGRSMEGLITHR